MKPDRRSYNAAYKAEAVRLAVERNNVTSVARHLDIGSTTLQCWVDLSMEHPENPFSGNGKARDAEWSAPIWYTSGYIRDPAFIVAYSVGAL